MRKFVILVAAFTLLFARAAKAVTINNPPDLQRVTQIGATTTLHVGLDSVAISLGYGSTGLTIFEDGDLLTDGSLTALNATLTASIDVQGDADVNNRLTAATSTIQALHVPVTFWATGPIYSSDTITSSGLISTTNDFAGRNASFTYSVDINHDLNVDRNAQIDGTMNVDDNFTVYGGVGAGGTTISGVGEIDTYSYMAAGDYASATRLILSNVERITAAGHAVLDSASVTTEIAAASGTFTGNVFVGGLLQVNGDIDPVNITYTGALTGGTGNFGGADLDPNYPVDITSTTGGTGIFIKNTAGGASIKFHNTVNPGVASATLGAFYFNGDDTGGGADNEYVRIAGKISDPTAGSEDGVIEFQVVDNGIPYVNYIVADAGNDAIYLRENVVAEKAITAATATVTGSIHAVTDIFATGNIYASGAFYGDGSLLSGVGGSAAGLQAVLNIDNTAIFSTSTGMSLTASDTYNTLNLVHNLGTGQALKVVSFASDPVFATFAVSFQSQGEGGDTTGSGLLDLQSWTSGDILRIVNRYNGTANSIAIYNSAETMINAIDREGRFSAGAGIYYGMINEKVPNGSGYSDLHLRDAEEGANGNEILTWFESDTPATDDVVFTLDMKGHSGEPTAWAGTPDTHFGKITVTDMRPWRGTDNGAYGPRGMMSFELPETDGSTTTPYLRMNSADGAVYVSKPIWATQGAYFATGTTYVGGNKPIVYGEYIAEQPIIKAGTALIVAGVTSFTVNFVNAFPTSIVSVAPACGMATGSTPIPITITATGTIGFAVELPAHVTDCEMNWIAIGN